MLLDQDNVDHYREHGYVIVENFLTAEELNSAHSDIEAIIPGWLDYARNPARSKPAQWDETNRSRRSTRFPFTGTGLNAITLHPQLRAFAQLMTAGAPVFCEQADLTYKCRGHFADRDQVMHVDYGNHTLAYPPDRPAYWQTAYLVYYTDVTENLAPTAVCSRQRYRDELLYPMSWTRASRAELYNHEVYTVVPAGSLLAYSMRTFHRGTAFRDDGARVAQFITYSPANCPWLGIVGWPEQGVRPEYPAWMAGATPEERELFGFPPPGHDYWDDETRAGVAARFPGIDLTPYGG